MLTPIILISSLLYAVQSAPTNGKCLEISLPVLSELCQFGPSKNDSNGCPVAPDIICKPAELKVPAVAQFEQGVSQQPNSQSVTVTEQAKTSPTGPTVASAALQQQSSSSVAPQPPSAGKQPQQLSAAPPQSQPVPSAPQQLGNEIRPQQPQAIAPQPVIVSPQIASSKAESAVDILRQNSGSLNETTEEPARNFTFEDMLGSDFLHVMNISQMPEPEAFRKAKGPPENASGKFHRCKIPADCYNFREPAEWCKPKKNIQWKGKSCFCATDTMTPACIVERTDGDKIEWTFCSSFSDLKCI